MTEQHGEPTDDVPDQDREPASRPTGAADPTDAETDGDTDGQTDQDAGPASEPAG